MGNTVIRITFQCDFGQDSNAGPLPAITVFFDSRRCDMIWLARAP